MDAENAISFIQSLFDTKFCCPFCSKEYDGAESETATEVVSYWGEDDHDFSCNSCGMDFVVRETVHRTFEAGKTSADIDD